MPDELPDWYRPTAPVDTGTLTEEDKRIPEMRPQPKKGDYKQQPNGEFKFTPSMRLGGPEQQEDPVDTHNRYQADVNAAIKRGDNKEINRLLKEYQDWTRGLDQKTKDRIDGRDVPSPGPRSEAPDFGTKLARGTVHVASSLMDTVKQLMGHGYSPGTGDTEGVDNAFKAASTVIGGGAPGGMRGAVGAAGGKLNVGRRAPMSGAPAPQEIEKFYEVFDKNKMSSARTANELGITQSAVNRRLRETEWQRPAVAEAEAEAATGGPKQLGDVIRNRPPAAHEAISQPSVEKMILDEHRLGSTPASIAAKVRRAVGVGQGGAEGFGAAEIKAKINELLTSGKYGR